MSEANPFIPKTTLLNYLSHAMDLMGGISRFSHDPKTAREAVAKGFHDFLMTNFGDKLIVEINGERRPAIVNTDSSEFSNSTYVGTYGVAFDNCNYHTAAANAARLRPDYAEHEVITVDEDTREEISYNALDNLVKSAIEKLVGDLNELGIETVTIAETGQVADARTKSAALMQKILENKPAISLKLDALKGLAEGHYYPEQIMGVTLENGVVTELPKAQVKDHGAAVITERSLEAQGEVQVG